MVIKKVTDNRYFLELTEREIEAIDLACFEQSNGSGGPYKDDKRIWATFNNFVGKAREKWQKLNK